MTGIASVRNRDLSICLGEEQERSLRETLASRPTWPRIRRSELPAQLAHKVTFFVGSAESQITDVPGLTLYRHPAPTSPAPVTYEPSVAVVVQGRKQVELGPKVFLYDAIEISADVARPAGR